MLVALTGLLSLAFNWWSSDYKNGWLMLAQLRIGIMPLTALTLVTCALFAPQVRHRWILIVTGLIEGGIFAGVVIVKLVLPGLGR